jgi:hypothetical protein
MTSQNYSTLNLADVQMTPWPAAIRVQWFNDPIFRSRSPPRRRWVRQFGFGRRYFSHGIFLQSNSNINIETGNNLGLGDRRYYFNMLQTKNTYHLE